MRAMQPERIVRNHAEVAVVPHLKLLCILPHAGPYRCSATHATRSERYARYGNCQPQRLHRLEQDEVSKTMLSHCSPPLPWK